MKVADDGKSINITEQEAIKLATLGFVFVCEVDGKVIAIVQKDKVTEENNND
jgi:hypothetical protein